MTTQTTLALKGFALSGMLGQKAVDDITTNYHRGNIHSKSAHKKARKGAAKAKQAILGQLARSNGLSCEALEGLTGLSHQSCSARISELRRDGRIVKAGTTKTKSGSSCAVYRITSFGETQTALGEQRARRQA